MASLLFIAPPDLGEAVLATGALEHAAADGVETTVVCAPEAAELFRAVPGLRQVYRVDPEFGPLKWVSAWRELAASSFDLQIDGRGGVLGRTLRAGQRVAREDTPMLRHRVEDWTHALNALRTLAPKLWIDDEARAAANDAVQGPGPLLALAPGGVSESKRWPAERFAAVARRLVSGPLAGARIALLGAALRDADITRAIAGSLDADGVQARDLTGALDLLAAAALMENATLCLGNDNALTHLGAAAGAPTLTLFGPTDERVRAPFGPRARALRGRSYEELMSGPQSRNLMDDLSVDAVEAAALDLLRAGGLR